MVKCERSRKTDYVDVCLHVSKTLGVSVGLSVCVETKRNVSQRHTREVTLEEEEEGRNTCKRGGLGKVGS